LFTFTKRGQRIVEKIVNSFVKYRHRLIHVTMIKDGRYVDLIYPNNMDRKSFLAKVKTQGYLLRDAPDAYKADKEIVLAAVKDYGYALKLASPELRADKQVVMAAVKNVGGVLEFASEELKADKQVFLAAV